MYNVGVAYDVVGSSVSSDDGDRVVNIVLFSVVGGSKGVEPLAIDIMQLSQRNFLLLPS